MGCSMGKHVSETDLNNYFVRVPVTPEVSQALPPLPVSLKKHRNGDCQQTQDKEPKRKWIRSVSVMDTRCSLTTREKFQIMKSWKGITRELGTTGWTMFLRLLELNADVRPYFNVSEDMKSLLEIRANNKFMDHVILVMHTLDEAITSIGDTEYVQDMLRGIGKTHKQLKHFNFMMFEKVEEPFIFAVKETLGDRFSANIENIYRKTIQFIIRELAMGFNEVS